MKGTTPYQNLCSWLVLVCVIGCGVSPSAACALSADENALVEGAKLCTQYLPRHERQYGIPEHLLAAIASTESGRFHKGLGLNLPWPWTINVNGKGYFFETKEEAVAAVNKLRGQGYQSIDVGCMQVNLHHHPNAFASVEQAFDPAYNVGYAAGFLKRNFMEEGSWRKATGDYHSRTTSFGDRYAEQVFGIWGRIVKKVADARAGRPVINTASNATVPVSGSSSAFAHAVRPSSYHALHMRSISVASRSRSTTREKGVLVIRPQKEDDGIIQVSEAKSSSGKSKVVNVTASPSTAEESALVLTKAAKVINISGRSNASSVAKGQFEPAKASSSLAKTESALVAPQSGNKMFVFDN